ncbi:MAG: stage II sporulation protein M [Candidatus Aenigmatarchaeota archaeon]
MLEKIWLEQEREEHFAACLVLSAVFTFASIVIARYFVPFKVAGQTLTGLIAVVLASLAASYPLIKYLEEEETEETEQEKKGKLKNEFDLLERHREELYIYLAFFLGATLAFGVAYSFMPDAFETQREVIGSIRPDMATGRVISPSFFMEIFTNNASVFFTTLLLSFFLTAGMVFILVWNASILGVFLSEITQGLIDLPVVALSYLPHGILEVAAYITAGLSGFFLSHEVKEVVEWEEKSCAIKLMMDSFILLGIGLGLLILAAVIESAGV